MKLSAVILAAGRSERFGGNKLLADFGNRPMVSYPLEAVASLALADCAVVTGHEAVAALAGARGFDVIDNPQPELGQAHSIHLAVRYAMARGADALMLVVADQPLLTGASLARLARAFADGQNGIACLRDETHMGNPAVFAAAHYPALLALEGDRGARALLRENEAQLTVVPCTEKGELTDCDTAQALESLKGKDA